MKLGKQPVRHDARTLMLAKYLKPDLPPNPSSYDWSGAVANWLMFLNDQIGDCTIAAAAHLIMEWTADNKNLFTPTDHQIVDAYSAITGYNPADPNTDQGAVEIDVLNAWRKDGIAGHKIGAYAKINLSNIEEIKAAIWLFGGCYLGVALPSTAQGQNSWELISTEGSGEPDSWGGHAVPALAYDDEGITVITWGAPLKMSWDFFRAYVDEAYAILSPDFVSGTKPAPNGFDMESLIADLNSI